MIYSDAGYEFGMTRLLLSASPNYDENERATLANFFIPEARPLA